MPMFPSYRNESTDLYCKSIDWFLYVGNTGMKKAKKCSAVSVNFLSNPRHCIFVLSIIWYYDQLYKICLREILGRFMARPII